MTDCSCCGVAADVLGEHSEDSSAESDEEWTVAEGKQRQKQRAAASQRVGNDSASLVGAVAETSADAPASPTDDPWNRPTGDPWARSAIQISATSIFEMIRMKQEETKKLVDEITWQRLAQSAVSTSAPETSSFSWLSPPAPAPIMQPPPGMQTQSSRKKQRNAASAKAAMQAVTAATSTGSQTDVALPHTMRDILWTPAALDPIIDFYDGEAITEGDRGLELETFEESMAEFKIGAYNWNNTKTLVEMNMSVR